MPRPSGVFGGDVVALEPLAQLVGGDKMASLLITFMDAKVWPANQWVVGLYG